MFHKKRLALLIILPVVVAVGAIVIGWVLHVRSGSTANLTDAPVTLRAAEASHQPYQGKKMAPVQIVIFEDLKCVNCALFNKMFLPYIEQKYIKTGMANYTFYNLAFIPGSLPAANAARCLYAQKKSYFFKFIDYVYAHQPPETEDWATMAQLLQFAKEAVPGVQLETLSQCIVEGRYNAIISDNLRYAEKIMHDKASTPSIYVNGRLLKIFTLPAIDALIQAAGQDAS